MTIGSSITELTARMAALFTFRDGVNKANIYGGNHDLEFSKYTIEITGGFETQSDFTNPVFETFGLIRRA